MIVKAPVSLCIIVKDEPLLEQCLQSIKPYVEEIVVVDTGSTDNITQKIAKKYADIFEVYTECNDKETGLIEDFSMARQRSFDLATKRIILWSDADDTIEGCQNLNTIIEDYNSKYTNLDTVAYMFPYEYSYNELGVCTLQHYRERLIFNPEKQEWRNPVHEVICPKNGVKVAHITREDIVFKHHRQFSKKIQEPGRNLRILRKYYEKVGDSDARQLYYLGLECSNHGLIDEAIQYLIKYIAASGWEDEQVMACLKLVDIYQGQNNIEEAIKWAFKTIEIKENWCEGYLALARMFYLLAIRGGVKEMRNWEKCSYFAKAGLQLPATKTLLFINPLDREANIYKYLNVAQNKMGDIKGALDSVIIGMQKEPNDPNFVNNRKLYDDFLARQKIVENTAILKGNGTISQEGVEQVAAIINNQPISNISSAIKLEQNGHFTIANKTNNEQEWVIPETYDFNSFPIKMTDNQLQAVVIFMWKQFMLSDELLSAIKFLENAPYAVRHTYATQKALKDTKGCIAWLYNDNNFVDMNEPGNPGTESGNPLPNQLVWQEGGRFNLIANNLPPNSSLVDFGCMDGCFTNRYGLLGHHAVGLDAVKSSIDLANKKAAEFNTGARHIHTYFSDAKKHLPNKLFDYATSTDTYEHLADPVKDMLIPAHQILKSNGKFLLCTPHGPWMRNNFVEYADPWVQMKDGKSWLMPRSRAHLVAPTVWTVADHFRQANFYVKNSYVVLCEDHKDVEGQGNIFVEAHIQPPINYPNMNIVFFIGDGLEQWTPETVKKNGIGGSELMAIHQAKGLAALGHKISVYNSCGKDGEGIYDGVEYYETNKFQDLQCDVLIVSRRADMLADRYNIQCKLRLLWVHDILALNGTNEMLLKADRIIALSQWHKQFLVDNHNLHPDHIIVSRNGIDLTRFNKQIVRNQYKCVNSSSPDRSWPILLEIWPEIKKQVPKAELHLFYGFKNWEIAAQFDKGQADLIVKLKNQIKDMASMGVVFHDRVNQEQLAEEFLSAGTILYSTWFKETSCISMMEAQAAGLKIITSNIAALKETVADRGILIDGDWTSVSYKERFIAETVKALQTNDNESREKLQQYAVNNFGLERLAKDWHLMLYRLIEEVKINPMVPYYPTTPYRQGGQGYYDGDTRNNNHNKLKVPI